MLKTVEECSEEFNEELLSDFAAEFGRLKNNLNVLSNQHKEICEFIKKQEKVMLKNKHQR